MKRNTARSVLARSCCALLFILLAAFCFAARCRADAVDDFVKQQMQQQHIPGLSLAVLRDGHVVKLQGYGSADIEQEAPASADTVYPLASLTKQFTATAILLLVQDGRLQLDEKIGSYLRPAPREWVDITVRHLLTHTSGIKDYINELHAGTCHGTSAAELTGSLSAMPLNFKPGTAYAYSNTNYLALGLLIEQVTGESYDKFLKERVFAPLGMVHTRVGGPEPIVPHRAGHYVWADGQLRNAPYLEPTIYGNADAGLTSSAADMALWDMALWEGKVLSPTLQATMFTPAVLADHTAIQYGFGWATGVPGGPPLVSHSGSLPGTSTHILRYLDAKLTVIVLANRSEAPVSSVARHIAGMYDPHLASRGAPATAIDPAVTAKMKAVLEGIQNSTLDDRLFAKEMWAHGNREQTVAWLHRLFASYGTLRMVSCLAVSTQGDKRQYFFDAEFGDVDLMVDFTLDANGKVTGMGINSE